MNVSRSKLFYRIKEIMGMSPNDLIRRYRLETAAQMLRQGKSSVSEVAYSVGISSLSYFSKAFKQQFGILPKDAARK
ncbi:MAG: helix-turn-helix transcriptional regulator [Bacteroidales bacterium]|nr:helix-turn-helix transcriptional regulator [Bacteroidales bacterium]